MMEGEEIYDWVVCQVIGYDHDQNKVYKVIDKYREYWALKIVPFSVYCQQVEEYLIFCDEHRGIFLYQSISFSFRKSIQNLK